MKEFFLYGEQIGKGNLILVNSEHRLKNEPERKELEKVTSHYGEVFLKRQVSRMMFHIFQELQCFNEIVPVSGYRSFKEQKRIYENSKREKGEEFTKKYVARPNHSEHQTGLAIDLAKNTENIDFLCPHFPRKGICQKFREKASLYGFIERYKRGKEETTKIAEEPWHFRYVGYPHSEWMENGNMTLEEYMEYLKTFKEEEEHLITTYKDREFELFYVPIKEKERKRVSIPDRTFCQASGDNEGGIVLTLWRNLL